MKKKIIINNFKKYDKKWNIFFKNYLNKQKKNNNKKKKYYILNMFPYPSGKGLHIGHTLGYIISDIITRYKKMSNYNVFNPIGYDTFGLPTEYYSYLKNKHPLFITKKNIFNFNKQLNNLSILFNKKKILYTSNPKYYKWTQWIFIKLFNSWYDYKKKKIYKIKNIINKFSTKGYNKKYYYYNKKFNAIEWNKYDLKKKNKIINKFRLLYKKKTYINWCNKLQTVLSNEEIYKNKSIRGGFKIKYKKMNQWFIRITPYLNRLLKDFKLIKYPKNIKKLQIKWIGKKKWMKFKNLYIYYKNKKKFKINLYIYKYNFFFKNYTCLIISTFSKYFKLFKIKINKNIFLNSKKRFFFLKTKYKYLHPNNNKYIPIYISNYIYYEYNINNIYLDYKNNIKDKKFIISNNIKIKKKIYIYQKNIYLKYFYKHYLYNRYKYKLKDILFSRQKYWGEPIPIYYNNNIPFNIKIKNLPLLLPKIKKIKPLSKLNNWAWNFKKKKIVNNNKINNYNIFKLDNNIMSSWAGSNWYFLKYLDLNNNKKIFCNKKINKWLPINIYIGGAEHTTGHLLYSRFLTKFFYDINILNIKEPFYKYIYQGIILHNSYYIYKNAKKKKLYSYNKKYIYKEYEKEYIDIKYLKKNNILNIKKFIYKNKKFNNYKLIYKKHFYCKKKLEKMSKSKLNTINPNKIINKYGVDVYRLYIIFLGPYNKNKIWNTNNIKGIKIFLNKIYLYFYKNKKKIIKKKNNKWEKYLINKIIYKIKKYIKKKKFNICISKLMTFFNKIYYNKILKKNFLKKFIILLSIFAPNISEEINKKFLKCKKKIINKKYPLFKKKYFKKKKKYLLFINNKYINIIYINKLFYNNYIFKYIKYYYTNNNNIIKNILFIKKKIYNIITY
ncbi:MAG: class I tRNA ligase family protein [Candidatus Shikimatogenerans sp. Tduv]|uniref:leucine--tRNA ligase n=1 Tax=Candidatus Shikimatogenerans sp. Tduv TaxID=3158567 RepID=A0AAU7QSI9_9FLAO